MIPAIVSVGLGLLDKLIPDVEAREKAKIALLSKQQEGELRELELAMSAILAEAKSEDKWTSRARPSFLYVIYVMVLSAIPMGFLYAFFPEVADKITTGLGKWLNAIPESLWTLFGAGYLGYAGARSWDKARG